MFERGEGFGWFELLNTRQVMVLRKQLDFLIDVKGHSFDLPLTLR